MGMHEEVKLTREVVSFHLLSSSETRRRDIASSSEALSAVAKLPPLRMERVEDGFSTGRTRQPALVAVTTIIIMLARAHAKTRLLRHPGTETARQADLIFAAIVRGLNRRVNRILTQRIAGLREEVRGKKRHADGL